MKALQNIAIIVLIALIVTVIPGGGTTRDTVMTAISMAFLAGIGWFVYRAHREYPNMVSALSEGWRAVHWGSIGLLAFLVAANSKMFSTGAGTLLWIGLLVLAITGLFQAYRQSQTY
jgi:hypothetical protein